MVLENNLTDKNKSYVLSADSNLFTVSQESPRAAQLLSEYGLHCISCFFSEFDTLENGAKIHGMSDYEMNSMINEINEVLQKEFIESKDFKHDMQTHAQK